MVPRQPDVITDRWIETTSTSDEISPSPDWQDN